MTSHSKTQIGLSFLFLSLNSVAFATTPDDCNENGITDTDENHPIVFAAGLDFGGPAHPQACVAEDFDHDGDVDIASANYFSNDVTILANDGSQQFSIAGRIVVPKFPHRMISGDLNNDGWCDLALTSLSSTKLTVLLNEGDAGFSSAHSYEVGPYPWDLAAGDLDRDGALDLLVTHYYSETGARILFNDGHGAFVSQISLNLNMGFYEPCAEPIDIDADGDLDLVATQTFDYGLTIIKNEGFRQFAGPEWEYYPGIEFDYLEDMTTADFNGDGFADLATLSEWGGCFVFFNFGTGILLEGSSFSTSGTHLEPADAEGDGDTDLFVLNYRETEHVVLFRNLGMGIFDPYPETLPSDRLCSDISAADFNNDGYVDFAIVYAYPNRAGVLKNDGTGVFELESLMSLGPKADHIASADFDGDGDPDFVATSHFAEAGFLLLNDGHGVLSNRPPFPMGSSPGQAKSADINGDSMEDIVVASSPWADANTRGFRVFINQGLGHFAWTSSTLVADRPESFCLADLDEDSFPDLISTIAHHNSVYVQTNRRDGSFNPPIAYGVGPDPAGVAGLDFDGDGDVDLVVLSTYGGSTRAVTFLRNNGHGVLSFGGISDGFPGYTENSQLMVFDIDGDSNLDILCGAFHLLSMGNGSFGPPTAHSFSGGTAFAAGDFDLDRDADFAIVRSNETYMEVWRNHGRYARERYVSVGGSRQEVLALDIDQDGKVDLATANSTVGSVSVLLNQSIPSISSDCDANGTPDSCEIDCNSNGISDYCDIVWGPSNDATHDGIPDECQPDCNGNFIPDSTEIADGSMPDCNLNNRPDECDVAEELSRDCNSNGVPDECAAIELDCDPNQVPDDCEVCGDLDRDQDVDGQDFDRFLAAYGKSNTQAGYTLCADADADELVALADYQAWLACYRAYVGNPLIGPPPPTSVGDMNGDGRIDGADIQGFTDCLTDPAGADWVARIRADIHADNLVDTADLGAFVEMLIR